MPALPVHPPQDRETVPLEGMRLTSDGGEVGKVFEMGSVSCVPSTGSHETTCCGFSSTESGTNGYSG